MYNFDDFKKWWLENGKPPQHNGYELFKKQFGFILKREEFRKYIKRCQNLEDTNIEIQDIFKEKLNFYINKHFIKYLENGITIEQIKNHFNVTDNEIKDRLFELKQIYNIIEINGIIKLEKNVIISNAKSYDYTWEGQTKLKFGIVSDNHLCNKSQQLTFLHYLYDLFKNEGIDTVFNCGDLSDGYYKNRPDHVYDLIDGCIGVDNQAEYIIKNYPKRDGIITKVISGNHDETHIQNGGADIVKRVSLCRPDFENLGHGNAIINISENCKIELLHPLDGAAYALSYSAQRYVDSIQSGEKPNILIVGHHHKAMYFIHRNIHILEAGTTCGQTLWMKRKKIMANIGGWIITIYLDKNGSITRFIPEYVPLYKIKHEDY